MNLNVDIIVERCYAALPPNLRQRPWCVINHGYDILDSEEKLNAYIASYGEMHIKKCRKAFQNFPFDDLCHRNQQGDLINVENFEIFDWGCGQGIGTLTLLQCLNDRKMLHGVQRVTLIEPSEYAINRAHDWVRQSLGAHTVIRSCRRTIPSNGNPIWNDIDCHTTKAIHIFSNILDIRSVGLLWLADMISNLSPCSYLVCVGPQYGGGISRIADFYNYMGSPACFADFATYPFGYTSITNHPYGIEVKGFKFTNSLGINNNYREQSLQQDTDELAVNSDTLSGLVPDSIIKAYRNLQEQASNAFEIYLRPNIGIEKPDFVLTNISRGIIIINVCDDISDFERIFDRVTAIKQALFDTYVKSLKIDTILNSSVYNSIKIAIFFTSSNPDEVEKVCADYYRHLDEERSSMDRRNNQNNRIPLVDPTKYLLKIFNENIREVLSSVSAQGFRFDYYQEIKNLFLPKWHPCTEGNSEIKLTRRQEELLNSDSKRLRVKGVAGCGKTQLLAYKCVKENLRTGSKVLIVTYNITLIKYIRMRLNEVPVDFSHGDIDIINYHQFFLSKARRYYGPNIPFLASDNASFFEPYKDEIIKNRDQYQTIIVDEAQDYISAWFDCLGKYFLTEDGSFFLFGDGEQNIYKREQEPNMKMPRVNGFGGSDNPWRPMSQRISMRMLNPRIAQLASNFANAFELTSQPIGTPSVLNLFDYKMGYWYVDPNNISNINPSVLAENLMWIITTYNIHMKDVVVLSQNIELLRDTDKCYRNMLRQPTMRTFESAEEYENLNERKTTKASKELNLRAIRRVAKVHFTTQTNDLKFSTIASFKGWESKTIILLLQNSSLSNENDNENEKQLGAVGMDDASLIYVGITRAKENLFIINIGNQKYHAFFQNNIRND